MMRDEITKRDGGWRDTVIVAAGRGRARATRLARKVERLAPSSVEPRATGAPMPLLVQLMVLLAALVSAVFATLTFLLQVAAFIPPVVVKGVGAQLFAAGLACLALNAVLVVIDHYDVRPNERTYRCIYRVLRRSCGALVAAGIIVTALSWAYVPVANVPALDRAARVALHPHLLQVATTLNEVFMSIALWLGTPLLVIGFLAAGVVRFRRGTDAHPAGEMAWYVGCYGLGGALWVIVLGTSLWVYGARHQIVDSPDELMPFAMGAGYAAVGILSTVGIVFMAGMRRPMGKVRAWQRQLAAANANLTERADERWFVRSVVAIIAAVIAAASAALLVRDGWRAWRTGIVAFGDGQSDAVIAVVPWLHAWSMTLGYAAMLLGAVWVIVLCWRGHGAWLLAAVVMLLGGWLRADPLGTEAAAAAGIAVAAALLCALAALLAREHPRFGRVVSLGIIGAGMVALFARINP